MFIKVGDKRVHFEESGKGEPLLLVHGWGGTLESLKKLSQLASAKYKTILLDLPGFGKSDNPDPDWGTKEYAGFIADFLKKIKIDKVHYFGHSLGGGLGILLSAKRPELINKLILVGSSYKRERRKETPLFFKKITAISFFKKIIYRVFFPNSDLLKFPHLEGNFRKIVVEDLSPLVSKVKKPTLILWGETDRYTPVKLARDLKFKIKNSKLKIFKNIGHALPLKYPEKVYKEIEKFL